MGRKHDGSWHLGTPHQIPPEPLEMNNECFGGSDQGCWPRINQIKQSQLNQNMKIINWNKLDRVDLAAAFLALVFGDDLILEISLQTVVERDWVTLETYQKTVGWLNKDTNLKPRKEPKADTTSPIINQPNNQSMIHNIIKTYYSLLFLFFLHLFALIMILLMSYSYK